MVKRDRFFGDSEITRSDNVWAGTVSNGAIGSSSQQGTSGTAGHSVSSLGIKKINHKYHFKGKYPKPN